jgi:type III secretory pathway component EscV
MMEAMATQLRMGGSLSLAPKFVAGAVGAGVVSVLLVALWGAFVIAMFANVMKLSPQVRQQRPTPFPLHPRAFSRF